MLMIREKIEFIYIFLPVSVQQRFICPRQTEVKVMEYCGLYLIRLIISFSQTNQDLNANKTQSMFCRLILQLFMFGVRFPFYPLSSNKAGKLYH